MNWVKRRLRYTEYGPYMEQLRKLMIANTASYQEFIMVSVKSEEDPWESDYYVGVPCKDFLNAFDAFIPVEETDLPKKIDAVHIADASSEPFMRRFILANR